MKNNIELKVLKRKRLECYMACKGGYELGKYIDINKMQLSVEPNDYTRELLEKFELQLVMTLHSDISFKEDNHIDGLIDVDNSYKDLNPDNPKFKYRGVSNNLVINLILVVEEYEDGTEKIVDYATNDFTYISKHMDYFSILIKDHIFKLFYKDNGFVNTMKSLPWSEDKYIVRLYNIDSDINDESCIYNKFTSMNIYDKYLGSLPTVESDLIADMYNEFNIKVSMNKSLLEDSISLENNERVISVDSELLYNKNTIIVVYQRCEKTKQWSVIKVDFILKFDKNKDQIKISFNKNGL